MAQHEREFCPTRPGIADTGCVLDAGGLMVETALAEWTRDATADGTERTLMLGETLVRYGLGPTTEAQVTVQPFGRVRMTDPAGRRLSSRSGFGDVTLGVRQNLRNPDGSGVSIGVQPELTVPTGRDDVGQGTWSTRLSLAATAEAAEAIKVELNPSVEAAADEDGSGRHLRYGSVIGASVDVTDAVGVVAELAAYRDQDPGGHATEAMAALSIAWQPADDLQFDAGCVAGLNRNTPDLVLSVGVSRRF